MRRHQGQGRRQHEEAQILVGRKTPDTPTPPFCLEAPVSPGRGFSFARKVGPSAPVGGSRSLNAERSERQRMIFSISAIKVKAAS